MKLVFILTALFTCLLSFGHDDGHGPTIKDESLFGGVVTGVIKESEINKGREAELLYKAELVYESRKPAVKVYLYDNKMKTLDLTKFSKSMKAILLERGGKGSFTLQLHESLKYYVGERPINKRVPFNIDIRVSKGDQKLFGAFDGLD
jgi:hypothetical protein